MYLIYYDVLSVVRWCGPTTSSLAIDDNNKLHAALYVYDLVCFSAYDINASFWLQWIRVYSL